MSAGTFRTRACRRFVRADVPAALMASVSTATLTVVNPAPGGGTSAGLNFPIIAPVPTPTLTSLSPTRVMKGGPGFTLTLTGTGFDDSSRLYLSVFPYSQYEGLPTTLISPTQITAQIPADALRFAGPLQAWIVNGVAGITTTVSNRLGLNVVYPDYPAPTLSALAPASALAGSVGFTLHIVGTGFGADTQVSFGSHGSITPSSVPSGTDLYVPIPSSYLATVGVVPVGVTNPSSGPGFGGASGTLPFTVAPVPNPVPTLTEIGLGQPVAGGPGFDLQIYGTGFVSGSLVQWDGAPLTTTFVSGAQLGGAVPASLIDRAGTHVITVTSPAPGGGTSNSLTVSVFDPIPSLTGVTPSAITAGGPGLTLTLTGTGFTPDTATLWDGQPLATTFVSPTQVTATVPAVLTAAAGVFGVVVRNPAPGGGFTPLLFVTVTLPPSPVPSISALVPGSAFAAGPALTLTVSGTGFVALSQVQWNGASLATTFVSPTRLTALVPAALTATPGRAAVTVSSPGPGGGASSELPFDVVPRTWVAASESVGGDNWQRALWTNTNGTAALWLLDPSGQYVSQQNYGPYQGWTAQAISTGQDNNTRVLWTRADGAAALWVLDSQNRFVTQQIYGPYAGWACQNVSAAPDGTLRVLWTRADGAAALWVLDSQNRFVDQQNYGPYAGWTPKSLNVGPDGVERMLWASGNAAAFWRLDANKYVDQQNYGPYAGFTATDLVGGPNGVAHAVWTGADGGIALWALDGAGQYLGQQNFGPFAGWAERSLAVGTDGNCHLLWDSAGGAAAFWRTDAQSVFIDQQNYGPY